MNVGTRAHQLLAPPARELPCGRTHRSAPTVGCCRSRYCRGRPACLPFVFELPPQPCCSSLFAKEGQFVYWYSLKLLRFCKEEVSRSDGGDSSQFAFFESPSPFGYSLLGLRGRVFWSAPTVGVVVPRYCRGRPACLPFVIELPPQRCCGLTALLWGAKAPVVASNALPRCPS